MEALTLFRRRISRHGLIGAARLIPENIRYYWRELKPRNLAARLRERAVDRELGIETAGNLPRGALEAEAGNDAGITCYQPVPRAMFEAMIGCLPQDLSSFCFIDVGSGKGRALVLAAQRGFAEVVGIEISARLHRVAQSNLARVSDSLRTTVQSLNLDARRFVFPTRPTVVFLSNPFGAEIMREVVANIERVHRSSNSPVFLLYHYPEQQKVLQESGKWREIGRGALRRDVGFENWKCFVFDRKPG